MVLMMENILHHVGCIAPCNSWDKLWTSTGGRISEPSVCWLVDSIWFRISFLRNQWMEWFLCAEEAEYVWTTVAYVISQVGCPGNGSRDLKRMLNDLLIYKSWTIHGYQHGSHRFLFGDLKIWSNFTTTTQNNVFFFFNFFSSDSDFFFAPSDLLWMFLLMSHATKSMFYTWIFQRVLNRW